MTDDIKTKEEAVDFVKQIFKQMGGTIMPPRNPGYYEAQTRLRTAYLCKDMVYPLSTPLDVRIVTLAHINGQ